MTARQSALTLRARSRRIASPSSAVAIAMATTDSMPSTPATGRNSDAGASRRRAVPFPSKPFHLSDVLGAEEMAMRKTLIAVCLLSIAAAAHAADKRVHKTAQLSANGSVSIDTHNGTVVVTTWNQPTVDVNARIEAGEWSSDDDVNATQINVTGSGSDVSIESDYTAVGTHFNWWGISRNLPLVHYTISVPATARLTINDHNSNVRITGLRNDLRVNSHNGAVELIDHDGAANIETHNGDIRAAYSHFSRNSSFETHNGAIEIKLPTEARLHV